MNFLEKDLEQIIFEADREELAKRGLKIKGKLLRQLKIGNYGIADLVSVHRDAVNENGKITPKVIITVYESKKEKINISAFLQAVSYAKGIKRYMIKHRSCDCRAEIRIVLIGKRMDNNSSFSYIKDILPSNSRFLRNYTYSYGVRGINFNEESDYCLIEEGF